MGQGTVELSPDSFDTTVGGGGIVLVDFWAPWCGPCRFFAPIFEQAAARYPDITFGKVNTDEHPELASRFQVQAIPTLVAIRNGVQVHQQAGAMPAHALEELIGRVRDMEVAEGPVSAADVTATPPEAPALGAVEPGPTPPAAPQAFEASADEDLDSTPAVARPAQANKKPAKKAAARRPVRKAAAKKAKKPAKAAKKKAVKKAVKKVAAKKAKKPAKGKAKAKAKAKARR